MKTIYNFINAILWLFNQEIRLQEDVRQSVGPVRWIRQNLAILITAAYNVFMITCVFKMERLEYMSGILTFVPILALNLVMSLNRQINDKLLRRILKWMLQEDPDDKYRTTTEPVRLESIRETNRFVYIWFTVVCIGGVCNISKPLMYRERVLPIRISNADHEMSIELYLIHFALQTVVFTCVVGIAFAHIATTMVMGKAIIYRYKTIAAVLRDDTIISVDAIIKCHQMHCETLDIIVVFQEYNSIPGFLNVCLSVPLVCFVLYACQTDYTNGENLATLVTAVFQMFMQCFMGEFVKKEANEIQYNFYCVKWYEMNVEDRRNMLILLTGAGGKEVTIKVGRMFELSLPLFTSFLRLCFSYSAMLSAMS